MNILWIAQRDLHQDLNAATWLETTKSLANKNHDVTLVTISTSGKKYQQQLPNLVIKEILVINHFPLVAICFHLKIIIFSLFWLFSIRPEVIITHPYTALFLLPVYIVAKFLRLKTKFVLDIRTLPVRLVNVNDKIKNVLNNTAIYVSKIFFDGITVITPALQRIIIDRFHVDETTMAVWMSGANIDLFQPKNDKIESSKDFIVMYHGVLVENRGIVETIRAMVYINKKYPEIKLNIVGKGLVMDKLKALVHQLKLNDSVHFHGAVAYHEIPAFISKADVGIIPLPDELCWQVSSPLKLIEYLAMAKPVILSPIEAHTSVLNNCPAAIFLESTKPEDISDGIIKAYRMRQQLPEIGIEGRKFVMNNFTWDHQATKLEKFIKNL